jgi:methylenetetrahydrofolate dehydrogenase (NADP+)/methenyltetrahydrofolate cyclohydrolase
VAARALNGAATAAAIRAEVAPAVAAFARRWGRPPGLHLVLVGADPASQIYVRSKEKFGREAGLTVVVHPLPATTSGSDLLALVAALNADPVCDGILVQSPLPPSLGKAFEQQVTDALDPAKDVDGFHPTNVGRLVQGRPTLAPCTPAGVIELLVREGVSLSGRHAVVLGRSDIVGKPMALLLLQRDATVTIAHSKTTDLGSLTRQADILVAAVGRPGFVTADLVKPGAVVIDVGISRLDRREDVVRMFGEGSARLADYERKGSVVAGDVHPGVWDVAGAVSPVPGGVGPLTIAMLLTNTLRAAEARLSGAHL